MARLDHIGVAVRDLETGARFYAEVLGLAVAHREVLEERGLKVALIPVGDSNIELLEPTSPTSTVAKFLETRGEGLHHVCFEVEDIQEALDRARAAGYALVDEKPRPGAGGKLVAFLHPKGTSGVLVELCQHGR